MRFFAIKARNYATIGSTRQFLLKGQHSLLSFISDSFSSPIVLFDGVSVRVIDLSPRSIVGGNDSKRLWKRVKIKAHLDVER